jgi:ERI1 exoribonuclease 3
MIRVVPLSTQGWNQHHTSQHAHEYPDLPVRPADWTRVRPQPFEKYLVLDLEGRVEILEFPVILLDPKTLKVLDRFHR